jgi:hypothetical protein
MTTMTTHTPGPWQWSEPEPGWGGEARDTLSAGEHGLVLQGCGEHAAGTISISNPADMLLIAAAPDLLHALICAEQVMLADRKRSPGEVIDNTLTIAHAAIAKATA